MESYIQEKAEAEKVLEAGGMRLRLYLTIILILFIIGVEWV